MNAQTNFSTLPVSSLVLVFLLFSFTTSAANEGVISVIAGPEYPNTSYGSGSAPQVHQNGLIEFAPCNPHRYKWYHFMVRGVKKKRITLRWTHTRKSNPQVIQYERPRIFYTQGLSDDRIAYEVCDEGHVEYGDDKTVFTYQHTFKEDTAWIAYSPLFTNQHASSLLHEIASSPFGVEVNKMGKSHLFKMELNAAVITDPSVPEKGKRGVWWLGREDAYETGGSLPVAGGVRFLLSDDPVAAALRRKVIFWVLPILSQDGVRMGFTNYPIDKERYIYLTTQWDKPKEFPELSQVREAMQNWKDTGRDVMLFHRFHSASYWKSYFRLWEDKATAGTQRFYHDLNMKEYMPHYMKKHGNETPEWASYYMHRLYPNALTSTSHTDFVYWPNVLGTKDAIPLNNDAAYQDGELYLRALAEYLEIPDADRAPPFLSGGGVTHNHTQRGKPITYRVVYRDLRGQAPKHVQVVIDGEAHSMEKTVGNDFARGVVYTLQKPLTTDIKGFYFVAENEVGRRRIPNKAEYPGPFVTAEAIPH